MIPPSAGLLDENIPIKIKYDFGEDVEVRTVRVMNWLGKKNGELLDWQHSMDLIFSLQ